MSLSTLGERLESSGKLASEIAPARPWWAILGVDPHEPLWVIELRYRTLVAEADSAFAEARKIKGAA
jgi:hypothetical protein